MTRHQRLRAALVFVLLVCALGGAQRAVAANVYADSSFGGMSADGRFILFDTSAANVRPGPLTGIPTCSLEMSGLCGVARRSERRRSVLPPTAVSQEEALAVDITDSGRYVLFFSTAPGIGAPQNGGGYPTFYVHDRTTGATSAVFQPTEVSGQDAWDVQLSEDGRWLVFASDADGYSGQTRTKRPTCSCATWRPGPQN